MSKKHELNLRDLGRLGDGVVQGARLQVVLSV